MNTKKDKVKMLQGMQKGTRPIAELLPITISMWEQCPNDPDYLIEMYKPQPEGKRISKKEYETYPGIKLTLDLKK